MKMQITGQDLAQLTADQKRNLSDLWIPQKYDVAVAYICKDIANEEYDEFQFVVGNIELFHTHVYLTDIREICNSSPSGEGNGQNVSTPTTKEDHEGAEPIYTQTDSVFGESFIASSSPEQFHQAVENMQAPFDEEEGYDEDESYDEFSEEDLESNYERPTTFNKEDCVPLLNIGQMIEILQRNNFGKYDFYLSASTYEVGCELGKNTANWDKFQDYRQAELCDVLWESVKALL